MRIGYRLALVLGVALLAISGILSYVALGNVAKLGRSLGAVYDSAFIPFAETRGMNAALILMRLEIYGALNNRPGDSATRLRRIAARQTDFALALRQYRTENLSLTAVQLRSIRDLEVNYPALQASVGQVLQLLANAQRAKAAVVFESVATPLFDRLREDGVLLLESEMKEAEDESRQGRAVFRETQTDVAIAIALTALIGLLALFATTRMVIVPLRKLTFATTQVAQGDFSYSIKNMGRDEFGQLAAAFNQMTAQLERSRNASKESLERLAEAQSIAKVGSWEWDIIANKVLWSDELYRIFGLNPREFEGTYEAYMEYVHPEDRQLVAEHVGRALCEKSCPEYYHRIRRHDEERIILASGITMTDAAGKVTKMTGVARDVTEDKQMERDLKQARDAALDSARMKSEFLANMSHEIRTPMNGVIGMTELLLDTGLTETQREYTETVRRSADSLLSIISDILDFSKIEAGKLHFESIVFDLCGAAEAAVDLLAERAGAKSVELNLLVDEEVPPHVCGDPGRLQQVLTNLVSNAVKFTAAGEVRVRCKLQSQTDSHVLLRFSVTDTGIGISETAKRTVFQPFTQGDGSTTRQYGGTGLGLVICKQLVELMGGEIGVDSKPEQGSTFWFTVRFEKDAECLTAAPSPARDELHGLRVLVVDDNPTNRKILMRQTAAWGMLPTEAESAARGLQSMREALPDGTRYDVALLDLDMPDMNGVELARAIKADPELAPTRLILMPSSIDREMARVARAAGIETCLRKPVRRAQLFNGLVRVMRQGTAPAIQQEPVAEPEPALAQDQPPPPTAPDTRARVLIAEDNLINQTLAAVQLRKLGYSSDVAANGRQALAILFRAAYDIVLMDCQMPEMDGYEATREIRRREGRDRHTVIIAMTAHSMAGDREKCLAAGMDDYLNKPVKMEDLRLALERWQTRPDAAAVAARQPAPGSGDGMDQDVLDNLRALQDRAAPGLLQKLITLFLTDAPAQLEAVRGAVEQQQALALAQLAHALRGVATNMGARGMATTCAQLEALGQSDAIDQAPVLLTRLEAEFDQARVVLSQMAGAPP